MAVDADHMLYLGLSQIRCSPCQLFRVSAASNVDRFKSSFGVTSLVSAKIFQDIKNTDLTIKKHKPILLWWALTGSKKYPVEKSLGARFGLSKDTVHKWIWLYCAAVQALKERKVSVCFWNLILSFIVCSECLTYYITWSVICNLNRIQLYRFDVLMLIDVTIQEQIGFYLLTEPIVGSKNPDHSQTKTGTRTNTTSLVWHMKLLFIS
jgi:hypothetical protein